LPLIIIIVDFLVKHYYYHLMVNPNSTGGSTMDTNTVAAQIATMISNLREDVSTAQDKLNAAKIALAEALAAFKPGNVGRPVKAKRTRKQKAVDTVVAPE